MLVHKYHQSQTLWKSISIFVWGGKAENNMLLIVGWYLKEILKLESTLRRYALW